MGSKHSCETCDKYPGPESTPQELLLHALVHFLSKLPRLPTKDQLKATGFATHLQHGKDVGLETLDSTSAVNPCCVRIFLHHATPLRSTLCEGPLDVQGMEFRNVFT